MCGKQCSNESESTRHRKKYTWTDVDAPSEWSVMKKETLFVFSHDCNWNPLGKWMRIFFCIPLQWQIWKKRKWKKMKWEKSFIDTYASNSNCVLFTHSNLFDYQLTLNTITQWHHFLSFQTDVKRKHNSPALVKHGKWEQQSWLILPFC